jgi:CIC family chloride channel protein
MADLSPFRIWLARLLGRDASPRADVAGPGMESRRTLAKWVVLSTLIGIVAGVGAIIFFTALHEATVWFLGVGAGFYPPAPA